MAISQPDADNEAATAELAAMRSSWQRHRRALSLVRPLSIAVAAVCILILLSHVFGFERGYRPWPGGPATSPTTAITVFLLACGMACHHPIRKSKVELVLVAIAVGIAILRMAEIAIGFSVIPSLLPSQPPLTPNGPVPAPIVFGWNTGLGIALSGTAILAIGRFSAAIVQGLASLALASPGIALIGFSYGLSNFYGQMSLYSASILMTIAIAVGLATSRRGIVRILLSPHVAGHLARRQLLGAFLIPYLVGVALYRLSAGMAPGLIGIGVTATAVLIASLMSLSIVALDSADRQRRLAERAAAFNATHDYLTGLPNRRMFTDEAQRSLTRTTRSDRNLCLLMLDIDHFKSINDEFGHPAGDQVLRCVADAIIAHVRAGDLAARIGGEEFVLLLPDTSTTEALHVADRLRQTVEEIDFKKTLGVPRQITISAGIAKHGASRDGLKALLHAADTALYTAKEKGRNRVELASAAPSAG